HGEVAVGDDADHPAVLDHRHHAGVLLAHQPRRLAGGRVGVDALGVARHHVADQRALALPAAAPAHPALRRLALEQHAVGGEGAGADVLAIGLPARRLAVGPRDRARAARPAVAPRRLVPVRLASAHAAVAAAVVAATIAA